MKNGARGAVEGRGRCLSEIDSAGTTPAECPSCQYPSTGHLLAATSSSPRPSGSRYARGNKGPAFLRPHRHPVPGSSGFSRRVAVHNADARAAAPAATGQPGYRVAALVAARRPAHSVVAIRNRSGQARARRPAPGASLCLPVAAVDQQRLHVTGGAGDRAGLAAPLALGGIARAGNPRHQLHLVEL